MQNQGFGGEKKLPYKPSIPTASGYAAEGI